MPRTARIKNLNSVYHVMCRSISEVDLFKEEEDKIQYLNILKEYRDIFLFKIYAYCLMSNHCHIIIDANGADISKIFHGVNQKYAYYFNRKHKRHGHLFQDRFKSKIIENERYLITLSAYIHANPISISSYQNRIEKYKYSSLGIYLGLMEDKFNIIDKAFIMSHFSNKHINAKKLYLEFIRYYTHHKIEDDIEFENDGSTYISERKIIARKFNVEEIINFLINKFKISENTLRLKNFRNATEQRAIFVLLMRCFCNYKYKNICEIIGGITQSRVSSLCTIGGNLIREKDEYKNLIEEFTKACAV